MSPNPFQNFTVRFKRGDPIFEEGDRGDTMFIIQSGEIGLFRQSNGKRQSLGVLEKGDFFGEMSILEGRMQEKYIFSKIIILHSLNQNS